MYDPVKNHEKYMQRRAKVLEWSKKYQQEHRTKRTEYRRRYRQTPEGKITTLRTNRKYELENPERKRAWSRARDHIKKTTPCIICGNVKVHKHHPDPLKPLEVIMLCPLHHVQAHK